jgi:hypothetical protein
LCGVTSVVPTTLIVTRPTAVAQIDRIISDDRGAGYRVGVGNGLGLCAVEVLSIRHVLLLGHCRHMRGCRHRVPRVSQAENRNERRSDNRQCAFVHIQHDLIERTQRRLRLFPLSRTRVH